MKRYFRFSGKQSQNLLPEVREEVETSVGEKGNCCEKINKCIPEKKRVNLKKAKTYSASPSKAYSNRLIRSPWG